MNALAKLESAHRMLAEVSTASDAKKVMDIAAAAEDYAKRAKLGEESELYAHKIKIDAQTLLGGFLKQMPKSDGGRPAKTPKTTNCKKGVSTLSNVGISHALSSRSQALHTAKEKAPELHEKVRNKKVSVAQVPQEMARYKMTEAEVAEKAMTEIRRHTTRWLESVAARLNSGTCPKMTASEIDASLGVYKDDEHRKLTPARLESAADSLRDIAKEWKKL